MDINCLTECDVLAISSLTVNEIAKCVPDTNTLALLADLITSIGETLSLLVGQRQRFQQNCKRNQTTTTTPETTTTPSGAATQPSPTSSSATASPTSE